MMSVGTIRAIAQEHAERAAEEGQTPYVCWNAREVDDLTSFPFPFLGDYVPEGWELVDTHFVDSSGLGQPGEPALTIDEFKDTMKQSLADNPIGTGWAVTQAGQFQVYVGEYRRTA